MGYQIEKFNASELNRVSLPGAIASSLFWVLPAGNWKPVQLDMWWMHFTNSASNCNRYGMLLVKNRTRRSVVSENTIVDFAEVVPNFNQLNKSTSHVKGASVFITSGAYPQPGWGVLIELSPDMLERPDLFENLVSTVFEDIQRKEDLHAILEASDAYKKKATIKSERPIRGHIEPEEEKYSRQVNGKLKVIDLILAASSENNLNELRKLLDNAIGFADLDIKDLLNRSKAIERILNSVNIAPNEVQKIANRLLDCTDEMSYANLLEELPPREGGILRILKTLLPLSVRQNEIDLNLAIQSNLEELYEQIKQRLEPLHGKLQQKKYEFEREETIAKLAYEKDQKSYTIKLRQAELQLRQALAKSSNAQWNCGPVFLKNLEDYAHNVGLSAQSLKWEPVRMIGWKLQTEFPELAAIDLLDEINDALQAEPISGTPHQSLNGSLFADYIYYMVTSVDKISPRQATMEIIDKLLKGSEVRRALSKQEPNAQLGSNQHTKKELVDRLLTFWGWPAETKETGYPLMRCIEQTQNGQYKLCKEANETRVILEGSFKDLVRVTFNALGWNARRVVRKIKDQLPEYRFASDSKKDDEVWKMTLDKMTAGAAAMLLKEFMPLAFPTVSKHIVEFSKVISPIVNELNKGSHYPPLEMTESQKVECGTQISKIIQLANEIVDEFPWHFTPKQSFGIAPKIITGYAWSHSYREERMIRILIDHQLVNDLEEMLVWNPSKINPVMPDAKIL